MRKLLCTLFAVLFSCLVALGQNFKITESPGGVFSMPAKWESVITGMGYTASIVPISILDNNAFFSTTSALIISDGTASYSTTQIATIKAFIQTGKPVYFQSEYQSSYGGNQGFASIVNALGSSFTWGATQSNDQDPTVVGSFATTDNTVPSLPYFWYGCTGTGSSNVFPFMFNGTIPLSWSFCPSNTSYGKLITTSDQDWIQNSGTYAASVLLMENIIRHLLTPGLCGPLQLNAVLSGSTNVSCNGGSNGSASVSVTGGQPPYTYSWSPGGGTGSSITNRPVGTYTCTVTDNNSATDTVIVTITQPPALSSSGSKTDACINTGTAAVLVFGGTPPYSYSWSPSGGTAAAASGLTPDTFTVTYTDDKGCSGTRSFIINSLVPATPVPTNNSPICENGALQLSVTEVDSATYSWTGPGGFTDTILNPSIGNVALADSGDYAVTVTVAGCTSLPGITHVTINPTLVPSVSVSSDATANTLCAGTNVTFTATPVNGGTAPAYQWRKNGGDVGTNSNTYSDNTLSNGDVITVRLTSNAICRSEDTVNSTGVTMTVNPILVPSVTIDATSDTICDGTNVTFTATPVNGGTTPVYQWLKNGLNVGTNSDTYSDNSLNNGDVITVRLASSEVCRSADTVNSNGITMTVFPVLVPSVTIASDTGNIICTGTDVTFTATPINGGTTPVFQWRKNGLDVGTNSNTYSDNALNNSDVITVRLTSNATCRSVDTVNSTGITMTVNPYPVATATPATQTLCSGDTTGIALTSTVNNTTFNWSAAQTGITGAAAGTGDTIAQTLINAAVTAGTATYTIIPTAAGCTGDTITALITINPRPDGTATPDTQTLCSGTTTSIALSADVSGTTYSWTVVQNGTSGAAAGNGNAIAQALTNSGNTSGTAVYTITPEANGCSGARDTVTVTVIPIPVLTVTPSSQALCSGDTTGIALSAPQAGAVYSWTVGQTGISGTSAGTGNNIIQVLSATGTASGNATYIITPAIGSCIGDTVSATVTVHPNPVATATPAAQTLCSGASTNIALSADVSGTTYNWTVTQTGITGAAANNGNTIAQTLTSSGVTAGTAVYTITPTANSCPGDTIMVTVTVNPKPVMTATPASQTICSGDTTAINLSADVSGTTYSWTVNQTGVTGATASNGNTIAQVLNTTAPVTGTATYTVTPSANNCDGATAAVTITVNAIPAIPGSISGPDAPCAGSTQTYSITGVTGATSYEWTLPSGWTGTSTTNSITVTVGSTNGNITVRSVNSCGSSDVAAKAVTSTPVLTPVITISDDAPDLLCSGNLVTYTATISNGGTSPAYQWMVNGNPVGINSSTYTYVPQDGDTISCVLNSNYPCLTDNDITSNVIIMSVTPTVNPSLNIYVVENHVCSDTAVVFLATPTHGGATPVYQWKVNNINTGTNSVNFTYMPDDGDIVTCIMTSNATCANPVTVTSNAVPMSIIQITHPVISITANPGGNVANGQQVVFTANVSGVDNNGHQLRWYKNNVFMPGITGNTWTATAGTDVLNNTKIKVLLQSFSPCAVPDTAWSNIITMSVGTTGINDTEAPEGFKAYPNPSHNTISFEGLHRGDKYNLYDVAGRLLQKGEANDSNILSVDISKYAQGVYLFQFNSTKDKQWRVKVFKD